MIKSTVLALSFEEGLMFACKSHGKVAVETYQKVMKADGYLSHQD
jgi:hypothetical protein